MSKAGIVLVFLLAVPARAEPQVTFERLLDELWDLDGLVEYPSPRFTCRQFSSYDRKSKSPEEDWFANGDCGKYLRVEERDGRKEHVMMDAEGPGAIVRIWSANPKGVLRIYLDGAETPVLAVPMADLLGGKVEDIPEPIAGERSRGWNCYLPIPYARQCKVTSDEGGCYYHVNYRTYRAGTTVETFAMENLDRPTSLVDVATNVLRFGYDRTESQRTGDRRALRAGDAMVVAWGTSPAKIVELEVTVDAEDIPRALRSLLLTMSFDGEETVAAPLGDFFGTTAGASPYRSLPVAVKKDGTLRCRWVMPFAKTARLEIRNFGDQGAIVALEARTVAAPWTDRTMHFHAKWRTEFDVPTRPMRDWNYLTAEGRGVFVGAAFAIANPVKSWWGEGDEKIYVDGETFPSHFGTGTEDYYGYAWCCNQTFQHAFHGQPRCDGPGNRGHTSLYRWHVLDRIPFEKSFRFDMELWHWHEACAVTMSVVAYWYARPGGRDGFAPIDPEDLRLTEISPYVVPHVEDAIEGEGMRVIEKTARLEPQAIAVCSNESHMWWHDGVKVGDRMALGFPVKKAGRYRVIARFLKAADYGIVRLSVNGTPAGDPIDLYNDGIVVSKEIDLGAFDLTEGENRIGAEITGANPKAIQAHLFGLDYVRLVPAE